ncbi:non-hydrolyzing UDP-N-acetylglucosamine 2-epimerase [Cellulomonas sp. PhB143]|uniref:non-hydrolyzing UDP-N-acetylglucosamine 2-epimerase n=1 Tax=Cellulomonas sp. PhB143 TaxID=2485186 RepID=UPI000F47BF71|nr:UDP-N-acetylglucosamine 2-epimerase (non-hydrolyzing) [Cellulomonas sp. PhB143]ROS76551.1 UDP-N-acetylglucosamine 2-epimerase [Cellulomonas sp. PhB143]
MTPLSGAPRVVDGGRVARVLIVVGTRPEAIKVAPLARALLDHPRLVPFVVSTGQHPGLVEETMAAVGVPVDANLGIGRPGLTLNHLLGEVVERLEEVLQERFGPPTESVNERHVDTYPVSCLVHGDTTSAVAAAFAAFHLRIPVTHLEAGLRTGSTLSPYPEELNRQVIGRIAAFHLAPTERNAQNLVREGIDVGRIFVTGNTAIDALRAAAEQAVPYATPEIADLEHDDATRVVVVTAHRRESWGAGLERVAAAVAVLAGRYPGTRFVLPLHPNPAVAGTLRRVLEGCANVSLVAPMGYRPFARLLGRAYLAITDSGGIQEEAPALGTPVLVTRESTERTEGVEAGTLELVGTDVARIVDAAARLLDDPDHYARVVARPNPYGDGRAVERIVAAFEELLFEGPTPAPFGAGYTRAAVLDAAGYDREEIVEVPRGLVPGRPDEPIEGVQPAAGTAPWARP